MARQEKGLQLCQVAESSHLDTRENLGECCDIVFRLRGGAFLQRGSI